MSQAVRPEYSPPGPSGAGLVSEVAFCLLGGYGVRYEDATAAHAAIGHLVAGVETDPGAHIQRGCSRRNGGVARAVVGVVLASARRTVWTGRVARDYARFETVFLQYAEVGDVRASALDLCIWAQALQVGARFFPNG